MIELARQAIAEEPQTEAGAEQDRAGGKLPRPGNVAFLARLLQSSGRRWFCSFEIAFFGHSRLLLQQRSRHGAHIATLAIIGETTG
jgi:hypothetical protein